MTEQKIEITSAELEAMKTELATLKTQLESVTAERDEYKNAYIQAAQQHSNMWGLYSNTIDYVLTRTHRNDVK